ncbi:MAG: DoxX family protein [Bacteroidales bacterium]
MKDFWLWDAPARSEQRSLAILFLRVFIGIVMLTHGFQKLVNFNELVAVFPDPIGIGALPSLALATFAEVICSFLLILGLLTRPAALILVINMLVATFLAYPGEAFAIHELPSLYLAIYVVITVLGGGRYSMDWILFAHKPNTATRYCINLSNFDRVVRLFLSMFCWYFILSGSVHGVMLYVLLILSIPLLLTSFWGYCGLYKLLGISGTCRNR